MVPTDIKTSHIDIFQKNWAFTTSDSERTAIRTGSFGPCYVVTFTSGKFAAMAHIDDSTSVDSIKVIFDRFKDVSVSFEDVKVIILGGWKEFDESRKWGTNIAQKINDAGFTNISTKNMFSKKMPTVEQQVKKIPASEASNHYYFGALVDSKTGKTYLLHTIMQSLEQEQLRKSNEFAIEHADDRSMEVNISEVK